MADEGGSQLKVLRKTFLRWGAMAGAGLALPLGTLSIPAAHMAASAAVRSPSVELFTVPLPSPLVLEPVWTDASSDYYEIIQRAAKQEILPDLKTEVCGYHGIFPGPTVEPRSCSGLVILTYDPDKNQGERS